MDKKNYKEKILVYIGEDMPKISILIPIYNVEKYLQDCLESVIHQTERDIEIICVDDASVDGSLKILQEYVNRDNRLKLLKHTENKGLCKTRKDAVEVATGKYSHLWKQENLIFYSFVQILYRRAMSLMI